MCLLEKFVYMTVIYCNFSGDKPEIAVNFPVNLIYGKRITVTCTAIDGDPPFSFAWLKDGRELSNIQGITVKEDSDGYVSTLFISKLEASSNGNYTCRVRNSKGMDEKHGVLLVKGNIHFYILYHYFNSNFLRILSLH